MTEYRGSAIFVAHCQHCKLKTLWIIRSTPHSVDESCKLGVSEFTQHLVIENYCNGMNVSFQGPIGKNLRRTGKSQDKQFTEMLSRNLPCNLFYFLYFLVTTRVSNGMSNVWWQTVVMMTTAGRVNRLAVTLTLYIKNLVVRVVNEAMASLWTYEVCL